MTESERAAEAAASKLRQLADDLVQEARYQRDRAEHPESYDWDPVLTEVLSVAWQLGCRTMTGGDPRRTFANDRQATIQWLGCFVDEAEGEGEVALAAAVRALSTLLETAA